MKEYSKKDILKYIHNAHDEITRKKGKEYSPNVHEIQKMIDYVISKEESENNDIEVTEKWSEKYKRSIDCNNPKGFSQRAHCQGKKKSETKEQTTAGSSGSVEGPVFGKTMIKRDITTINNSKKYGEKGEFKEAMDASASGAYDVPFPSKKRKDPLSIGGVKTIAQSRAVKDKKFPKWGGPGGVFIKINEKCKKYPYCNQGDMSAIQALKEEIENSAKKYGLSVKQVEEIVLNEIKEIFI
jgi:hypothetical protein